MRRAEASATALSMKRSAQTQLEFWMDPTLSSKFPAGEDEAIPRPTFEETYPRYEFAELVRLALAVGAWLVNMRRRLERPRLDISSDPMPGEMNPAE